VKEYTQLAWDGYFQCSFTLQIDENNKFNLYETGSSGPIILLLHGGGFSGLTWALMSKEVTESLQCRCVALDLRGHGDTVTADEKDMSAGTLAEDIVQVIAHLKERYGHDEKLILVGHSLGGALAVHAALLYTGSLSAVVVIDVVEGTAIEALQSMKMVLGSRPKTFKSMEHANEWCVRSGYIRNLESARVSMIGQIVKADSCESANPQSNQSVTSSSILEEEEEDGASSEPTSTTTSSCYKWRINLLNTEPYWRGWFEGLSNKFLQVPAPKLLLLAGVDRLDRDLTIGQMQGKFQMKVLPKSGHAIQEDAPAEVADTLIQFLIRHRLCNKI